jgi:serine/threonine-protein kinase
MPNVVGSTVTEARAELPSGTEISIVEAAAPAGTPNGVVIDQDPAPGGDLPDMVTLTVATSQASTFLVDLSYVAGDISTLTDVRFSGVPQLNAVGDRLYTCYGETGSVQYNLGRNYTSFAAVAGIDDTSVDALTQVTVEVLGDQRSLATVAVSFGSPQELIVDTTGVLRLELRWSVTGFSSDNCGESYIAFGNARLIAKPGYEPPTPTD